MLSIRLMEEKTFLKLGGAGKLFSSFRLGKSPEADWKIIFLSTASLVLAVVALSAFMFVKVSKGEIFTLETETPAEERTLSTSRLERAAEYYSLKASEFERLISAPASSVDPSL